MKNDIYVIKLWSNVLLDKEGIDKKVISNVVLAVNYLMKKKVKVILVSSGAVTLWKKEMWLDNIDWLGVLESEQIFSSIWQASLINIYKDYFKFFNIKISQILLTRRDLSNKEGLNSLKQVINKSLEAGIVPIINENDVLSQEELKFSDNDELSAFITDIISAEKLIILSDIKGLYDSFPDWKIIKEVNKIDDKIHSMVSVEKSSFWKWWMLSKINTAKRVMELWVEMYLVDGKKEWVIEKIWRWKNPWTLFKKI